MAGPHIVAPIEPHGHEGRKQMLRPADAFVYFFLMN